MDEPDGSGICVDFDGTISPIVDDPEQAVAVPGSAELLRRLSERYATVAVVSGRPVSYLLRRLRGCGRTRLFGLYGLESATGEDSSVVVHPAAERWREPVSAVALAAEAEAAPGGPGGGAFVERKGLTVTLHYRQAPDREAWARSFARAQAEATGLVAHDGKMSVELRPPVGVDKGSVVEELGRGLGAVCFLGDDLGDLAAFGALARLRQAGTVTLAVAVASEEAPEALVAAADLVVDGPGGAISLLGWLAGG